MRVAVAHCASVASVAAATRALSLSGADSWFALLLRVSLSHRALDLFARRGGCAGCVHGQRSHPGRRCAPFIVIASAALNVLATFSVPADCIVRAAGSLHARGRWLLLIVGGVNTAGISVTFAPGASLFEPACSAAGRTPDGEQSVSSSLRLPPFSLIAWPVLCVVVCDNVCATSPAAFSHAPSPMLQFICIRSFKPFLSLCFVCAVRRPVRVPLVRRRCALQFREQLRTKGPVPMCLNSRCAL